MKKNKVLLIIILTSLLLFSISVPITAKKEDKLAKKPKLPSNGEMFNWVKDLCSFGYRRPGTEADHQAIQYISEKFEDFGLVDVVIEPVDIPLWDVEEWSLTVNGEEIPSFYMQHTYWISEFEGFTEPSITAPIVYIGEGTEEDYANTNVEGKIVLGDIRFETLYWDFVVYFSNFWYDPYNTIPPGWNHPAVWRGINFQGMYNRAVENGAVGFIGILMDYYDRNTFYPENPLMMPIPGLYLSKSDGAYVKELLQNEEPDEATLVLDGSIVPAVAKNVIGFLPGKTEDIILIHSHHDAPFYGAVEDAAGVAGVLGLAKYFCQFPAESREKTFMFVTLDTHFNDYQAHNDFIENHEDHLSKVIVDVCLEHIAKEIVEIDRELVETGFVEPRGMFITENDYLNSFAEEAVLKYGLERTALLPTDTPLGVPTDAMWFFGMGIPIISFISGPPYIYDIVDTPNKVPVDQLKPITAAFAMMIESIDATPPELIRSS
ncbi:MAG: M28 family peptidase [Promethearchaeota archaeon]